MQAIDSLRDSRDSDTKSSAGDKHETSREMAQVEMENYQIQLNKTLGQKNELAQINADYIRDEITVGSLVETNEGTYFISIGLGKIKMNGSEYFVISSASPIGQQLLQKKKGDQFSFLGREIKIVAVS